jgi:VWFA-related protein
VKPKPLVLALLAWPLWLGAPMLGAQEGQVLPGADEPPEIVFYSPDAGRPAYGDVTVDVDVYAPRVTEVIFLVDGEEVGRLSEPPYRVTLPLGDDVGGHRFEVVALAGEAEVVRRALETPPLQVDESLELELRQLYVTLDRDPGAQGEPLAAGDFVVLDNGGRQSIVTFETGDAALTVSLLLDASASMYEGRLEAALEGARAFVAGMRELDEASVYLFADSIRHLSAFSQDADEVGAGLAGVEAAGGTALNDTLYAALRRLEGRQGRRVVVLLSDGIDAHSALATRDVLWAMRRSQSLVYWIELVRSPAVTSPWRDSEEHVAEHRVLRELVEESGGRVVPIDDTQEAIAAFDSILAELRRQYVLGYYPNVDRDDGSWHEVEVRVPGKRVGVRVRGGYVD